MRECGAERELALDAEPDVADKAILDVGQLVGQDGSLSRPERARVELQVLLAVRSAYSPRHWGA